LIDGERLVKASDQGEAKSDAVARYVLGSIDARSGWHSALWVRSELTMWRG
jgi:hypothetical protein